MADQWVDLLDSVNHKPKPNLAGTVAPNADNDSTEGYDVGSEWIDTVSDKAYVCTDPTATSANWEETTAVPAVVNLDDIGDVNTAGKVNTDMLAYNSTSGDWEPTAPGTPGSHASSHEDGNADEISVADLSGLLADPQTPLTHDTSHEATGGDEIDVTGLSGLLADPQTAGPATDLKTSGSDVAIDSTAPAGADYILKTTGTTTATWQVVTGGGDVTAAVVLTDHELIRADGGGKGVQDSAGSTLSDSGNLVISNDITSGNDTFVSGNLDVTGNAIIDGTVGTNSASAPTGGQGITTVGDIDIEDGDLTFSGVSGGLVDGVDVSTAVLSPGTTEQDAAYFTERADHVNTPGAGKAEIWVSNDATQKLYFTDDAGTDSDLTAAAGDLAIASAYLTAEFDGTDDTWVDIVWDVADEENDDSVIDFDSSGMSDFTIGATSVYLVTLTAQGGGYTDRGDVRLAIDGSPVPGSTFRTTDEDDLNSLSKVASIVMPMTLTSGAVVTGQFLHTTGTPTNDAKIQFGNMSIVRLGT
jgi:hypothetical protein